MINRVFSFKKPYKINPDSIKSQTTNQAPAGKFDVIIAGAGPAGSTAAYFMAQQGLKVLLLERGCYPGAKVCGGVSIIAEHTHKLFPNFWDELEWERMVTDQSFWWMTEDSVLSTRYQSKRLAAAPYNRFTIKRIHLYQWLAQKAIDAGAILLNNHHVSEVLFKDNQAIGVKIAEPHPNYYLADIIV
ncbi:MAG: electron transfer flavoprotein-ubiquinone oxidoreductase, partial [Anaerospora sp.]|nr:electron transfer flavoprotein-ubiquinone oxidoreductase [Anaerospora sp.]